jgi:hypothetical protein
MIRTLIRATGAATMAVLLAASVALAGNPAGTGQPGAECGDDGATVEAPGFGSGGFAIAEEHYAGEGDGAAHSGNATAVSQYDVACYQLTQHAH